MFIKNLVKIIILFVAVGAIPILAYKIKELIMTLIRPCNYKEEPDTSGKISFIWKYTLWYITTIAIMVVAFAGIALAREIQEILTH